jgi:gluconolactonase
MRSLKRALGAGLLALLVAGAAAEPGVIDAAARYPEGPLYWNGGLLVAEMGADQVSLYTPGLAKRAFVTQAGCGPTAVAPYRNGLAVLCHLGARVNWVASDGRLLGYVNRTREGLRLRNPNDATADDRGGVYFSDPGAFSKDVPAEGALFYLSQDGTLARVASGLWYPNGVHFDPGSRTLFVSEHLAGKVWRYSVDAAGRLVRPQLVLDVRPYLTSGYREAGPDGLELGSDGRLYVALYGEGKLLSIALEPGRPKVRIIPVPMPFVTNVAFGPAGQAVTVGPMENTAPPFLGRVMALPKR